MYFMCITVLPFWSNKRIIIIIIIRRRRRRRARA